MLTLKEISKTLIVLDISLDNDTVCTSTELEVGCAVCATTNRNLKTLIALNISLGDGIVCTPTESQADCAVCSKLKFKNNDCFEIFTE